jgi:hypothetical protein
VTWNGGRSLAILIALVLTGTRAIGAQAISVSGNPGLLRISTAVAGTEPVAVSDAASTFTITTPAGGGNQKWQVTMSLNANMPAGVTLTASLAVPLNSQGTSNGAITLDVTPRAMLVNVKKGYTGTATTTYQLTATTAAGVIPLTSRTVTYTVTTYP